MHLTSHRSISLHLQTVEAKQYQKRQNKLNPAIVNDKSFPTF